MRNRVARMAAWGLAGAALLGMTAAGVQYRQARTIREALYAALAPVRITNCTLQRFGSANDGGYLMCGNLVTLAQSAYSYGIGGDDAWGCDVAAAANVPVHQYDCYDTVRPPCAGRDTVFHAECVGPERTTRSGLPFDTIAGQIERNGDTGKRLIVKMDVEGSEWRSLAAAPDHVLNAIDQMAVEFHGVEAPHLLDTAARLNEFFYVAHVHYNNYECRGGFDPFPSPVFEVLFVNKRIAVANPWVDARVPSSLDAPNDPERADCQSPPGGNEAQRVARWLSRHASAAVARLRSGLQ